MIGLIALGLVLSFDNFRTSVVLGGLQPTLRQSARTSLTFGLWDGLAPLAGLLVGGYLSTRISDTAELVAAAGLAGYGAWVIANALVSPEPVDPDLRTARRWLPLPLSLDNVAAGAVLGVSGYSPWLAPLVFGLATFGVSLAGHQVGRSIARVLPRVRTDLLTGIACLLMSGLAVAGVGDV